MDNDNEPKFDPTDRDRRRPRRLEDASTAEIGFPLVWIVIGGLAGLIVIGLVGLGVVNMVRQNAITPTPEVLPPLVEPVVTPSPLVTAPVVEEATATAVTTQPATEASPEATAEPTSAPAPGSLVVGGYAKVAGTDGAGLSMRAGPGRNNARIGLAEENDSVVLELLSGPKEDESGEDYVWWYVRHPDGTEGWVVEDFLVPAAPPQ